MSAEKIKAEKCHWQKRNAKGECGRMRTGIRIRVAPAIGQEILLEPDGDSWKVVEVLDPEAFNFVETPVVPVEVPKSLLWGISRMLEAREQFDNEYGPLLTELMATPFRPAKKV